MPTTSNRLLRYPLPGDPPNIPLDIQNLANDEDNVANIFFGTFAARGSASGSAGHGQGSPGSFYMATDTDQLFVSIGGNWREVPVGAVGAAPVATGDFVTGSVDYTKQKLTCAMPFTSNGVNQSLSFASVFSTTLNPTVASNIFAIGVCGADGSASGTPVMNSKILIDGVAGKTATVRTSFAIGRAATLVAFAFQSVAAGSRVLDWQLQGYNTGQTWKQMSFVYFMAAS